MSLSKKVKRCSHCGTILQDTDNTKEGYIDTITLKKFPDGVLLCNKCFDEEKNCDNSLLKISDEYKIIFDKIKKENSVILYVIDLFSFEGCFPSSFNELIGDTDIYVIATKRDLLPKDTDDTLLKEYVSHRLRVSKLKVKDVVLTSKDNCNSLLNEYVIKKLKDKNVYILGPATAGKSTLLKNFLKDYKNNTRTPISSSYNFEGTNLKGLRIPLSTKNFIYEIPSLPIKNSMLGVLEKPIYNSIVPTKEVLAKKFNISDKSFLMISGLCLIQLLSGEKTSIYCYFSNKLDLKVKKGDAVKQFKYILEKGDQKNTSYKYKDLKDFDVYDLEITEKGNRDLGILGLGWINFSGNNQKFRVFVPNGVYVYTTRSKVIKNVK